MSGTLEEYGGGALAALELRKDFEREEAANKAAKAAEAAGVDLSSTAPEADVNSLPTNPPNRRDTSIARDVVPWMTRDCR